MLNNLTKVTFRKNSLFQKKWNIYFSDFDKYVNRVCPFIMYRQLSLIFSLSRTTGIDDLLNVTIKIHFSVCIGWNCEFLVVVSPQALLMLCFCCWSWQGFCHYEKASHCLSVWPAHSTSPLTVSAIDLLRSMALHEQNLETKDFSLSKRRPLFTKWLWPLKTRKSDIKPSGCKRFCFVNKYYAFSSVDHCICE